MRPEFIFLDLGNVLFSFDRDVAFRRMSSICGADLETVRSVVMEGGLHEPLECGLIGWPEFHERFSELTATVSDADQMARAYSDMFTLKVDMLPVIAGIERAGCPMGILSNTSAVHWRHLWESGYAILPGRFSRFVLSYEAGAMKPDPAIYEAAAAAAGVPPERIFFCDDLEPHVVAARAAGWQAELFTSAARLVVDLGRRGLNVGL